MGINYGNIQWCFILTVKVRQVLFKNDVLKHIFSEYLAAVQQTTEPIIHRQLLSRVETDSHLQCEMQH